MDWKMVSAVLLTALIWALVVVGMMARDLIIAEPAAVPECPCTYQEVVE